MSTSATPQRGPVRRSALRRTCALVGRGVVALLVAVSVLGLGVPAFAGGVSVHAPPLAHGIAAVTPCGDLSAAVISYRTTSGTIEAVNVTELPGSCDGAQLWLTLVADGTPVGSVGPVVVAGTSVTAQLAERPLSTAVTNVYLAAIG